MLEDRKKLAQIPYKTPWNSGHLSLTDRKFKSYLDYPCESYLPIVGRPEKAKHKLEITDFFFSKWLCFKYLKPFLAFPSTASNVLFAHWIAFSLPQNIYSTGNSSPYPTPRLILFLLTHTIMLWFERERNFLNINEQQNGTCPCLRSIVPSWQSASFWYPKWRR